MAWTISVLTTLGIAALASMPLVMVVGRAGMLLVAQGAFAGVGAYAAAIASVQFGLCVPVSLVLAAAAGGVTALLAAVVLGRLSGDTFVLAGLAFVVVVEAVASNWMVVTKGPVGISHVPPLYLLEWNGLNVGPVLLVTASVVVGVLVLRSLLGQPFGLQLAGIREGLAFLESYGYSPMVLRTGALAVAGLYGGLAGGLAAHHLGTVTPASVSLGASMPLLLIALLSGADRLTCGFGACVVAIVGLPELLRLLGWDEALVGVIRQLLLGALLLLVFRFGPRVLGGSVDLVAVISRQSRERP